MPQKILVVDDMPVNVKLLADLLTVKGYTVVTAASGAEALVKVEKEQPGVVLLDVMMPGMSGYDVCRKIRENPATAMLPVVMVTALDPAQERVKGIEAGADDFLTKPINQPELLARVKSLLRIKLLHDELAEWNRTLAQRVEQQLAQLDRFERLKRFFSPQLAELIVNGDAEDPLKSHRREITVVFLDLRVGIAQGYATIGAIGFEGRMDYGAIGTVTNMAARLCGEAKPRQILIAQRVLGAVEALVEVEELGGLTLKGFSRPVSAFNVLQLKTSG